MKKYKALVVCGTGMGSSLMLKIQVERVVKDNELPVTVQSDVLSAAKGADADFFISMLDLVDILSGTGKPIVGIKNIVSRPEILAGIQKQIAAFEQSN
ncbi:MAG: PTS sugar transporter subunit IIB [Anaerolineaceae bacterium]|nr:PTS sugar transporter subunit IIB [Anaerolineaceae bacterium]